MLRSALTGVGRGGRGEPWPPLHFEIISKKRLVFQFRGVKKQISPLLAPPGKNFGKIPYCSPPWKNPSDAHVCSTQWLSQPKISGGAKMYDFRRIAPFSLKNRFSKQKMTIFSKNLRGNGLSAPPGYVYGFTQL